MLVQKTMEGKGLFPRVTIETGNDECIGEMVKEGRGITIMARESLKQEIKTGRLIGIPLRDENLIVAIDIIFKKGKTLSATAKSFINLLAEELGESTERLRPQ
jgi:DNA-binding transcriptional LysR family regulator